MGEVSERTVDDTVNETVASSKGNIRHLANEVGEAGEIQVDHWPNGDHRLSLHSRSSSSKIEGSEISGKGQESKLMRMKVFVVLHRGVFYIMVSALCYGSLGVFVQLTPSIHVFGSGLIRGLFLIIFSTVGILFNQVTISFSKRELFWILINGAISTLTQIFLFMGYSLAPVGDVSAIVYSSPLFSGILARVFLKEPLRYYDVILSLVCLAGVFLISKPVAVFGGDEPENGENHFIGTLWAVGGLASYSIIPITTRKLRQESTNALFLTLTFGILACPCCAILNTFIGHWTVPSGAKEIAFLFAIGFVGFFANQFYNLSLETVEAVFATLTSTALVILVSYVLQFSIFRVYPDVISGIGALLVGGAMILIFIVKMRNFNENSGQHNEGLELQEENALSKEKYSFHNPAMTPA